MQSSKLGDTSVVRLLTHTLLKEKQNLRVLVFFLCCSVWVFGDYVFAESEFQGKVILQRVQNDDKHLRGKKLGHPMKMGPMDIKRAMWGLHFLGKITVSGDTWEDPERVFDKKTISRISGYINDKLGAAKPREIVSFSIRTRQGETSGDVFVLNDVLNWRFSRIKGMGRLVDHQSVAQETSGEILVNWKLEPRKKQKYFYSENTLGFKTRYDYWITAPIREPKPSGVDSPRGHHETLPPYGGTIKEKLKMLKEWEKEGLISEEDYKAKVDQLLEQF